MEVNYSLLRLHQHAAIVGPRLEKLDCDQFHTRGQFSEKSDTDFVSFPDTELYFGSKIDLFSGLGCPEWNCIPGFPDEMIWISCFGILNLFYNAHLCKSFKYGDSSMRRSHLLREQLPVDMGMGTFRALLLKCVYHEKKHRSKEHILNFILKKDRCHWNPKCFVAVSLSRHVKLNDKFQVCLKAFVFGCWCLYLK